MGTGPLALLAARLQDAEGNFSGLPKGPLNGGDTSRGCQGVSSEPPSQPFAVLPSGFGAGERFFHGAPRQINQGDHRTGQVLFIAAHLCA